MKNVIIGTAGHIDHGKTCLIKALTDKDTDRLKEEKQRGITIELGFADLPNDNDIDIGIIDVPGHEKFVKHMLAGIGGIDIVLLIVAADEGFMPQTIEHFEILKMLKINKGIIVMTKIDMVDEEWLDVVREDIREHVNGTFLENAPIMEVSSHTKQGIDELRTLIIDMAEDCGRKVEDKQLFRLPVDRVFTIDGFGTVITGTLMEGSVETGDEIMIYPSLKKAKVRNIQVHGNTVKTAKAGQRTAVNISGIKREEIVRGNVLAFPGLLENTYILDVRIDMFDKTKRILKSGSRLHFYYGSAETLCKAVLLNEDAIGEGESCYAQLRFEEEIAVKRDDRFILRFYSPTETIGGGKIINSAAKKKKRFNQHIIDNIRIQDIGNDKDILEQILFEESHNFSDVSNIIKKFGRPIEKSEGLMAKLIEENIAINLTEDLILHEKYLDDISDKIKLFVTEYHEKNPVSMGMLKEEFRGKLRNILHLEDMKKLEVLINYYLKRGLIKEDENKISLKDFSVEYTDEQKNLMSRLESKYMKTGFEPPITDEVILEFKDKKTTIQLLEAMCNTGKLKKLNYQYYIHADVIEKAINNLENTISHSGKITLAEFRDSIGTSRKYAIMILEYADENKITKLTGDFRVFYR